MGLAMTGPRREYHRPWKRPLCWIMGHDWGMYWANVKGQRGDYVDICVRCGKRK